ncbi:MAG: PilZ domain-containing protein, partial [Candidatus Omnitrophica bacterium]|nr:PilZ domain-containing protein [Candidatus Omnitrophota bacterium]
MNTADPNNRRKFIRLSKIFPVEFMLIDAHAVPQSALLQGFTRNLSRSGLCVEINALPAETAARLAEGSRSLLFINVPLHRRPVRAVAAVVWLQKTAAPYDGSYRLGMAYESIGAHEQRALFQYALAEALLPAAGIFLLGFFLLAGMLTARTQARRERENRVLVSRLQALADYELFVQDHLAQTALQLDSAQRSAREYAQEITRVQEALRIASERRAAEAERKNAARIAALSARISELERALAAARQEQQ